MKRFTLLPDGTKVWPKYPQWKNTPGMPKPNRSRLARGKNRVKYNPLYASDRAPPRRFFPIEPFNRKLDL